MLRVRVLLSAAALTLVAVVVGGWSGRPLQSRGDPGLELTIRASPGWDRTAVTPAMLRRVAGIIRDRMRQLAVTGAVTLEPRSDRLVVQIPRVHDPARATGLILTTGHLMLFDFENDLTGPSLDVNGDPVATPTLYGLLSQVQKPTPLGKPQAYYLFETSTTTSNPTVAAGPDATTKELLRPFGGKVPANGTILAVPEKRIVVSCAAANGCLGIHASAISKNGVYYYLLRYDPRNTTNPVPELGNGSLVSSGTRADLTQAGNPVVLLQLTDRGSKELQKITRREAHRGQAKYALTGKRGSYLGYVQHFAIVLDGVLRSTPYIDFKLNPDGIPGPNAELDMGRGGTGQDAKDLALVLRTGAMPCRLTLVSKRVVH